MKEQNIIHQNDKITNRDMDEAINKMLDETIKTSKSTYEKELNKLLREIRDKILYPLSHENTELGKLAEGFGQATTKFLNT